MLEAWKNADGSRSDTLTYAILRREFTARATDERSSAKSRSASEIGTGSSVNRMTLAFMVTIGQYAPVGRSSEWHGA